MSPQEISELHRIALVNTGDKQQARRCVEAYLAGADRLLPHNRTTTMIWVRVGDSGEYESFDDLQEVVDYLNELGVGLIDHCALPVSKLVIITAMITSAYIMVILTAT